MYFHKFHHPYNFRPLPNTSHNEPEVTTVLSDTWRIKIQRETVTYTPIEILQIPSESPLQETIDEYSLCVTDSQSIQITDNTTQHIVLQSYDQMCFGISAQAWLVCFELSEDMRFYGMGEKNIGFEKSHTRTKFWNTDVWADFDGHAIQQGSTDPMYASFPVLLVKTESVWIGLMIPTTAPTFIDTGAPVVIEGAQNVSQQKQFFYLGAMDGHIDMVLSVGKTASEIVKKFTSLAGLPSRPPLWALGHHQSRWGYGSLIDASILDKQFLSHNIPNDAIWFDIDYMDGYRVFTCTDKAREGKDEILEQLHAHGRKLVAILDPGVKVDPSYDVCTEGILQNLFCLNKEGLPFIGFVWPGAAYFPDFSLPETRQWWANHTSALTKEGFDAFWIDMNDPSTGSSDPHEMLFGHGSIDHHILHNYYALGMEQATWEGLQRANPHVRPFLLTRSAMLGSSRYGAMWTGDNVSNYHHLRKGIEMTLSLSLSTMAFTGNDICGFGSDTDDELAVDWYRACMLFPLFRNHSANGTKPQEPWNFSPASFEAIRDVIQTRYMFIPYLYNQCITLSLTGEAIIRPMLYDNNHRDFTAISDQFMVGPDLLQGPKLARNVQERNVIIPEGNWLALHDGKYYRGHAQITIDLCISSLPLFMREGAIIPLWYDQHTPTSTQDIHLSSPLFALYCGSQLTGTYRYVYDSGEGYAPDTVAHIMWTIRKNSLFITLESPLEFSCKWAIFEEFDTVFVNDRTLKKHTQTPLFPNLYAPFFLYHAL